MKIKTPFIGGAYVARSLNLNSQCLVNLYPEMVDTKDGKEIAGLFGVPGKVVWAAIGSGPIYCQRPLNGYLYVLSASTLYRVDTAGNATSLGTIPAPLTNAMMIDNGTQLMIVSDPNAWIYDTSTAELSQINAPGFTVSQSATYQDGYFVAVQKGSQLFSVSNINDGTLWDALMFGSCTEVGDNLLAVISTHGVLHFFGEKSTEFWYNSGDTLPFTKIPNATTKVGIAAVFSAALCNDTPYFLGQSDEGPAIVYRYNGYQAERISTHAIELAIQGYATVSDAIAYSYQQEGHWFYVLNFPTGDATWVYDQSTGFWHERSHYNATANTDSMDRGLNHSYFNGIHLVGGIGDHNIYKLSLDIYDDSGAPLKWLRAWRAMPTDKDALNNKTFDILEIDGDMGVGLQSGQGSNPQAMLRWSNDGGNTWVGQQWKSMGAAGQFQNRLRFKRMGSGTDRVFELSGSDPVKRNFTSALLDYNNGS